MGNRQRKPHSTWLGRFIRGRRLDRNQLRRGSDRAETALIAMLAAAFALGVPFAARAAGAWEHSAAHKIQVAQKANWHEVPAVALTAGWTVGGQSGNAIDMLADARWTTPDGAVITSPVPVPADTRAGQTVRIWVDRNGTLTMPPLRESQISTRVALVEAGTVAGFAVTIVVAGVAARKTLDRRRMAAWEAQWQATSPRWTTRT